MDIVGLGLAALAGVLTMLSPCVIPLLPLVLGGAASEHKFGPVALAGGLAISFTIIGLFVATIGFGIGLDTEFFRAVAAVLLVTVGLILTVPMLQARLAVAAGPVSNWTEQRFGGFSTSGLGGQFSLGLLLGAVWVPCVGPTIGAASLLASSGENLGQVALTMLVFGFGAGITLALLGLSTAAGICTGAAAQKCTTGSVVACPCSPWEGPARGATRPRRGWRRPARGRGLWAHGDKRGVIRTVAGVVTGSA